MRRRPRAAERLPLRSSRSHRRPAEAGRMKSEESRCRPSHSDPIGPAFAWAPATSSSRHPHAPTRSSTSSQPGRAAAASRARRSDTDRARRRHRRRGSAGGVRTGSRVGRRRWWCPAARGLGGPRRSKSADVVAAAAWARPTQDGIGRHRGRARRGRRPRDGQRDIRAQQADGTVRSARHRATSSSARPAAPRAALGLGRRGHRARPRRRPRRRRRRATRPSTPPRAGGGQDGVGDAELRAVCAAR